MALMSDTMPELVLVAETFEGSLSITRGISSPYAICHRRGS